MFSRGLLPTWMVGYEEQSQINIDDMSSTIRILVGVTAECGERNVISSTSNKGYGYVVNISLVVAVPLNSSGYKQFPSHLVFIKTTTETQGNPISRREKMRTGPLGAKTLVYLVQSKKNKVKGPNPTRNAPSS